MTVNSQRVPMISAIPVRRLALLAGFSALSLGLSSCSVMKPKPEPQQKHAPHHREAHQSPPRRSAGPAPRNPAQHHSTQIPGHVPLSVSRVNAGGKYVALTFDDGPSSANTPRLLAILKERNVKATFFVVGSRVTSSPGLARQIVNEGHEIANHSYDHPLFTKLGDAAFQSQVTRTHDAIVRATGVRPTTLRPPYGAITQAQRQWMFDKYGYRSIMWSVDPLDWKRPGSGVITSRIVSQASPGGIILAHDIHAQTVNAMPATIDALLRQGYQFVTVTQLMAMSRQSS